jgi:hypothetical protein
MAHQSMARQGGEALGIPCTVWLHPLVSLPGCECAPKLYWDFTPDQAINSIKIIEDLDKIRKKLDINFFYFLFWLRGGHTLLDDCRLKKEFINQLRSDSTAELREMIVKIRSGLIPIDCFNNKISSIELHLGSVTQWMKEQKEKFPRLRDDLNRLGW